MPSYTTPPYRARHTNTRAVRGAALNYKCPECGGELDIRHLGDMAIVSCRTCHVEKAVPTSGRDEEAYLNSIMQEEHVTKNQDRGMEYNVDQNMESRSNDEEDTKIINVLTHKEIDEKIGKYDPPKAVREVLHSRVIHLAHYECRPRQEPKNGPKVETMDIDDRIAKQLQNDGIESFYMYQAEAVEHIMEGKSIVIEAPTAFGKTEAFVVPIINMCSKYKKDGVCALFVYPTKALGRDQHAKISRIASAVGMRAAVFDGDTEQSERYRLAQNPPQIIITNFDLLHHQMFRRGKLIGMLQALNFLVVDETHSYTGIFGSNVHHIIARLKRLTGSLQCIGASATLNDSKEFCENLFGQHVTVVRETGRRSAIDFAMMSPAVIKSKKREQQMSKKELIVNLATKLSHGTHKTMIFSNSHYNAERIGMEAKQKKLRAEIHRGGINSNVLKSIESRFRSGEVNVISCTPTLELGIDVGNVDTVISETIPSNRFIQRLGRAGREGNRGCALLVLGDDPISQYYSAHPGDYMQDEWVPHVDVENPDVLEIQTVAMASDRPLDAKEVSERAQAVNLCAKNGLLERVGQTFKSTERGTSKLVAYSIRGIGEGVTIYSKGAKVGERNLPIALNELHPGAVYVLRGKRYRVAHLEYPTGKRADIEPVQKGSKVETMATGDDSASVLEVVDKRECYGVAVEFCRLRITKIVSGYYVFDTSQKPSKIVARIDLETPLTYSFETKGVRFQVPRPKTTIGKESDSVYAEAGAYHAVEHVIIDGGRMITGAAASDINGMSDNKGLIYVYDDTVGGSGISKVLYDRLEDAMTRARDVIAGCPCSSRGGCPRCTMSYRCKTNNEPVHKHGALETFCRIIDEGATSTL